QTAIQPGKDHCAGAGDIDRYCTDHLFDRQTSRVILFRVLIKNFRSFKNFGSLLQSCLSKKILTIASYFPLPTCIGLTAPVAPPRAAWRCLNTWNLDGSGSLPQ